MNSEDTATAVRTLDHMVEIIDKEMLVKSAYVTEIVSPDLHAAGAICDGRRYCAIGTMVVAYGVKSHTPANDRFPGEIAYGDSQGYVTTEEWDNIIMLAKRREALAERPALQAVHDALNREAYDWIIAEGGEWDSDHEHYSLGIDEGNDDAAYISVYSTSPIEGLFESSEYFADTVNGRAVLRSIVLRAKERILAGDVPEADWAIPVPVEA